MPLNNRCGLSRSCAWIFLAFLAPAQPADSESRDGMTQQPGEGDFHVYCFVADGIQRYILERANLREMVGASAIVAAISDVDTGALPLLISELNIKEVVFGRRGGGGFTAGLITEEEGRKLLCHWPLLVDQLAPGLGYAQALGTGNSLHAAWEAALQSVARQKRHSMRHFPPATVAVARAPRTGLPAVAGRGNEALDRIAARKRRAAINGAGSERADRVDAVTSRLVDKGDGKFSTWKWPRDLKGEPSSGGEGTEANDRIDFPFRKGPTGETESDLAVIHLDGNGFGMLAEALKKDEVNGKLSILERERDLSAIMDDLCMTAMVQALVAVVKPEEDGRVPVRPLVLAGEDVTLLIRADLALPFVLAFTKAFECAARRRNCSLAISAGLAFVKAGLPFDIAFKQAEQMCDAAKTKSHDCKRPNGEVAPSTVAFRRAAGSLAEENAVRTTVHKPLVYLSGAWPRTSSPLPALQAFMDLAKFVAQDPPLAGACRRLISAWPESGSDDLAQDAYLSLLKNLGDRKDNRAKTEWESKLIQLVGDGKVEGNLPIVRPIESGAQAFSPLSDLVAWLAVGGESESTREQDEELR